MKVIVREVVTYTFENNELPDDLSLDKNDDELEEEVEGWFCNLNDPWSSSSMAAVTERTFYIERNP